jgi:hypothetical protein
VHELYSTRTIAGKSRRGLARHLAARLTLCRRIAENAHLTPKRGDVDQQDVERIARKALQELGVTAPTVVVLPLAGQAGGWQIEFGGDRALRIRCGQGSTPQWVRDQIFEQFLSR